MKITSLSPVDTIQLRKCATSPSDGEIPTVEMCHVKIASLLRKGKTVNR